MRLHNGKNCVLIIYHSLRLLQERAAKKQRMRSPSIPGVRGMGEG